MFALFCFQLSRPLSTEKLISAAALVDLRWVPLEEGYFAQYHIAETADFVVDTTQRGTI